jgi:hypothetical protein
LDFSFLKSLALEHVARRKPKMTVVSVAQEKINKYLKSTLPPLA